MPGAKGRYLKVERRDFVTTDPLAALEAGATLALKAKVPFALAGRLAVWYYVEPAGQQLTKDADFAVPYGRAEAVGREAAKSGYKIHRLGIGGVGISSSTVVADFVDRHPKFPQLFADAVKSARRSRHRIRVGRMSIPVVPLPFLIAMKLVPHEAKDERDVEELLQLVSAPEYKRVRRLAVRYLGALAESYLDVIARRIGHPGPGMKKRYK